MAVLSRRTNHVRQRGQGHLVSAVTVSLPHSTADVQESFITQLGLYLFSERVVNFW